MLTIGLIEDDAACRQEEKQALYKWSEESGEPIKIIDCPSDEAFFFELEAGTTFDILIIDVMLTGSMRGTDLAHRIREADSRVAILFLTQVDDAFQEAFEVGAVQYLIKPVKYPLLRHNMDRALRQLRQDDSGYFTFSQGKGNVKRVFYRDILYFESASQHVIIHMKDESTYDDWRPLKDVEKELPPEFVRAHRSYILNIRHVDRLVSRTACIGSTELPIGRNHLQNVRRAWAEFHV